MTEDDLRRCIRLLADSRASVRTVAESVSPLRRFLLTLATGTARSMTGIDPEDVAQETFALLLDPRTAERMLAVPKTMAYLSGIVRHIALRMRRARVRERVQDTQEQVSKDSSAQGLERDEAQALLDNALQSLTEEDLLILSDLLHSRSLSATAKRLRVSYAAVAKRRSRLFKLLSERFSGPVSPQLSEDKGLALYLRETVEWRLKEKTENDVQSS